KDRPFIWSMTGGQQRAASAMIDAFVEDDREQIKQNIQDFMTHGVPHVHRSSNYKFYLPRLRNIDTAEQLTPQQVQALYQGESS
ncbi:hypothetical protein L0O74_12195, partial [Bifidobacterium longum]|nr:hypothetical protein [Bifidobacterium longum]